MSMTAPRVTVPVEPTEKMLKAGAAHMRVDALHTPKSIYRAMLSAAPAPEGGAVLDALQRLRVLRDQARDGTAVTDPDEYDADELDAILSVIEPALGTRKEAPAEAGERRVSSEAELKRIVKDLITHRRAGDYDLMADDVANCLWPHLRAQPQARDDAQPVAWSQDQHDYDALTTIADYLRDNPTHPYSGRQCQEFVQAARDAQFTRPTPDALRAAREAVLSIKDAADSFRDCSGDEVAGQVIIRCDQALAALQAEQKGGA